MCIFNMLSYVSFVQEKVIMTGKRREEREADYDEDGMMGMIKRKRNASNPRGS